MIQERTFEVALFECDFCGTIHTSQEKAENHGCTKEAPEQRFSINQIVQVKFRVGAGLECVGDRIARGKVTLISKPKIGEFSIGDISRMGWHNVDRLSFLAPIKNHEWVYTIEPLEEGQGLITDSFPESKITPIKD